jgi:ADP-ribose pyrophosphatase YjhB (NUDIX family)
MTDQFAITQKAVLLGPAPERRVLLLKNRQGAWELPGGPLRAGESPEAGLKRAVSEVTGLDVKVNRPVHTTAWELGGASGSAFAVIYRARSETERATLAGEHGEAVWLDPQSALERDLTDAQRSAIKRATSL